MCHKWRATNYSGHAQLDTTHNIQSPSKEFSPGSENGRLKCSAALCVTAVWRNIFATSLMEPRKNSFDRLCTSSFVPSVSLFSRPYHLSVGKSPTLSGGARNKVARDHCVKGCEKEFFYSAWHTEKCVKSRAFLLRRRASSPPPSERRATTPLTINIHSSVERNHVHQCTSRSESVWNQREDSRNFGWICLNNHYEHGRPEQTMRGSEDELWVRLYLG